MYGLIGRILATPGNRDALAAILIPADAGMPGCLSYIVASDPQHPDALWITEVWDTRESHAASLQLPEVRAAIAKAKPIIAGSDNRTETSVLGGIGLGG